MSELNIVRKSFVIFLILLFAPFSSAEEKGVRPDQPSASQQECAETEENKNEIRPRDSKIPVTIPPGSKVEKPESFSPPPLLVPESPRGGG